MVKIVATFSHQLSANAFEKVRGGTRIRTEDQGFADLCLTAWLYHPNDHDNI